MRLAIRHHYNGKKYLTVLFNCSACRKRLVSRFREICSNCYERAYVSNHIEDEAAQ